MAESPKDTSTLGVAPETASNSLPNALDFMARQIIKGLVNTAIPVLVTRTYAGGTNGAAGYVDIKPLVCQTDSFGNALAPAVIYHVPYFRLQAGVAAVVIDPVPGDIGLAIIAQSDASALSQGATQPVQPGSWRCYSQADSFYVGGFLNKSPSVWIELTQNGQINIKAPNGITIDTPTINMVGESSGGGRSVNIDANVIITGDMTSGGKSYLSHTHMGVHGETSAPL